MTRIAPLIGKLEGAPFVGKILTFFGIGGGAEVLTQEKMQEILKSKQTSTQTQDQAANKRVVKGSDALDAFRACVEDGQLMATFFTGCWQALTKGAQQIGQSRPTQLFEERFARELEARYLEQAKPREFTNSNVRPKPRTRRRKGDHHRKGFEFGSS